MPNCELDALLILTHIPHLGAMKIRGLMRHFGSASAILDASASEIAQCPELGPKLIQEWGQRHKHISWKRDKQLAEEQGVELIPYTSPRFPKWLLETHDHPVILYLKGSILPADARSLAVVGTRQPSIYGKTLAEQIAQDLAGSGFTVVSGLARGIDTAAHIGAMRTGRTLAVIGSGLANVYPRENQALGDTISSQGAMISEFPMTTPPDRQNFPQRNRIVAGMTLGTLLIEGAVESGAMITIKRALEYKRKCFALPGRADLEGFRGNHQLIKRGEAALIENAMDLLHHFDHLLSRPQRAAAEKPAPRNLSDEERTLLACMPSHEVSMEEILHITKLPIVKVNVLLMGLVLKRAIQEFPGRVYRKGI